jgi:PAS domain S-box-containing protein
MKKQVIICVDDEIEILKSLKAEIRATFSSDYQIELAESGEEALELLEELLEEGYEIPLIISDYQMPVMKGDEFLRRVHLSSPKTLKIMLTGEASIESVANAIKYAKLYRYIPKPWEQEDFKLTIIEAINSYIQEQKLEEKNVKMRELNRKQAELIVQLHENENRLMKFLEAMPIGVFVSDDKGLPYYINSRAQELLGQEIVAETSAERLREIYQIYLQQSQTSSTSNENILQRALKGESATVDNIEIKQTNRTLFLEGWGTPIYDANGNISYAIAAFQDMTQRKKAEEELRKTEEKYRRIFENALEGIFQSTPDGRYLSVNPALASLYGYNSPEELIASVSDIESQVYVDPNRRHEFVQLMEEQGSVSNFESQVYRQNGEIIWITENARCVYDEQGQIIYYQGFIDDITIRKQAEEERQKFIEELFDLNCTLELSLENELRLTDAASCFVPNQFLSFLGYESLVDVKLGDAVEKEMSILFTDIRDFTHLSEKMTPEENFKFINSFLSEMEPAIIENQGFIDKYIGDAIMALFGNDADDAVKAGISMLHRLREYNQYRRDSGESAIEIGIGINTGCLMLGIVGGQNRMDGTVISDAVNLAARVEILTKTYGVPLIITHQTVMKLKNPDDYAIRILDRVQVKGKSELVTIYEVFDVDLPEIKEAKYRYLPLFTEALSLYQMQYFPEAEKLFSHCLQINPHDSVILIYLKRCQQLDAQYILPTE